MTYPAEELVHEGYRLDGRLGYMKVILQEPFGLCPRFWISVSDIQALAPKNLRVVVLEGFIGLGHGIAHFIQIYFLGEFSMADQD